MSAGKRYKFNGSQFKVQTALGAAQEITGISKADPAVVTSAAHGNVTADVVRLTIDSGSMYELDGKLFVVDNEASGTYELAGTDTTDYTTFAAGSPYDYAQRVTFSNFCELTGVNQQDAGADTIEVSTICSDAKEFEQGLSDSGTLTLDFNWAGNETVQAALSAAKLSGDQTAFKIVFPGTGGTVVMIGTVQSMSIQGSVNGVWTASAQIKLSGRVFTFAA